MIALFSLKTVERYVFISDDRKTFLAFLRPVSRIHEGWYYVFRELPFDDGKNSCCLTKGDMKCVVLIKKDVVLSCKDNKCHRKLEGNASKV